MTLQSNNNGYLLWLAVKGVLPNGAKPDKISCYKK
mgnify:CR=1 FL=1